MTDIASLIRRTDDVAAISRVMLKDRHYELQALAAMTRHNWKAKARKNQLRPDNPDWLFWFILAGRGFGKTRAGGEELWWQAWNTEKGFFHVIAPTQNDLKKTIFEGESGLLAIIPPELIKKYNGTDYVLTLANGSKILGFSAEKPERLRGPQCHGMWCDEMAAWGRLRETWDMARFGCRLGTRPRTIITTTPKPKPLIRELLNRKDVIIATGSTYENQANLAPSFLEELKKNYEGTRLGRQELSAELLTDTPGALWNLQMFDDHRFNLATETLPEMTRIVVAVDPAVTNTENSDETGITVEGLGVDGRAYLLADLSGKYSPDGWGRVVCDAYDQYKADLVVGETNNGGDMVEAILRTIAPYINYKKVHASRGKITRAEPVAALYEQGKVRHCGPFPTLEDQLTHFVPGATMEKSPDRADSLVWGLTELMLSSVERHDETAISRFSFGVKDRGFI